MTEPLLHSNNSQTYDDLYDLEQESLKTYSNPPKKKISTWGKLDLDLFKWPPGIKRELLNKTHDKIVKKTRSAENRDYTTIISAQAQPVRIHDLKRHYPDQTQFAHALISIPGKVELAATYLEHSAAPQFTGAIFTSFIVSALTLNATGERIAIAGTKANKHTLLIYDLLHGKGYRKIGSLEFDGKIQLLSFSPTAKKLLIASEKLLPDQCIEIIARIFSLDTNEIEEELINFDDFTYNQSTEFGWIDEEYIVARVSEIRAGKWFAPSKATIN